MARVRARVRRSPETLTLTLTLTKAEGRALEVVMVPWDHEEAALRQYARQHGMRWLAVAWLTLTLTLTITLPQP